MGTGFAESVDQYGVNVGTIDVTVRGILTPGPITFVMTDAGEEIEVDQSVDVLLSDLNNQLGMADLQGACASRMQLIVDGVLCRLVAFGQESSDPTVKLYLKIAR